MGIPLLALLTIWLNYMVKNEKHQGAEEKILCAARKIFTTKGMAGARMQDIANEAGINKALLHYYYRDKEIADYPAHLPSMQGAYCFCQPCADHSQYL